ncbi:MAG: D-alanyl-D-alanine carboxypeptidase/D-alanyl-D-alanine-endopeptidase [Thiobacillaceae bacterium]|nr:D-alanyl-D-alanine carboxypeptidase/D-alanyl-D-alanine-endopeptidase [Thiobacillaceae bacterium]
MWQTWRRAAEAALFAVLCAGSCCAAAAAGLPAPVATALAAASIPEQAVALYIQPLDGAAPLASHNAERPYNPASVMKLVTTLAALDRLGPAHVFRTGVYTTGALDGDRLRGDLVLKGGGDPALTLERFWRLLREVRARGIRVIAGDVLIDTACYDLPPEDPAAFDRAPLRPYNALPAALLVDYNTVSLHIRADDGRVRLSLDPPILPLDARLTLLDGPCDGWAERLEMRLDTSGLQVIGGYPAACGARSLRLAPLTPERTVAEVFRVLWGELGGVLEGAVLSAHTPAHARLLLEYDSPPLARLVADVNEHSNNVMARMLYLNLGIAHAGAPGTPVKGEAAVRAWLAERRLQLPSLVLENGSGLSRGERISALDLARLLQFAARRAVFHDFVASLPALGQEGTLRQRAGDHPFNGRAWLKTGSLADVRALAGYALDGRGRLHIFVFLVNHPRAAGALAAFDAALGWLGAASEGQDASPSEAP